MNQNIILNEISLTNFATFDNQSISFDKSFNSIIGETGSGKSLILDAIQLILGSRSDKKLIRKGCEHSVIEASFETTSDCVKGFLDTIGYPVNTDEIIIKRIIYSNGKSKCFLNFQSCPLSVINSFTRKFVDLVGQFENQKLLTPKYQLELLDQYSANNELLNDYQSTYSIYLNLQTELEGLILKDQEITQRIDYIDFQISEIEKLDPNEDDEIQLIAKKERFIEIENNSTNLQEFNQLLEGDESQAGIQNQLVNLSKNINVINLPDKDKEHFLNLIQEIQEIGYVVNKHNNLEFNEEDFSFVIDRLDHYQTLKRKFNVDTEGLISLYNDFLAEKSESNDLEFKIKALKDEIKKQNIYLINLADTIHQKRFDKSKVLSKKITNVVNDLKMLGAQIRIDLTKTHDLSSSGCTKLEIMAQTNPGEGFYPLKDIASGGELSRILLAFRQVLSTKDSISIFLFDEIDAGIGGETALSIGKTLKDVSKSSQIIAITHLPQIAFFSNKLIIVKKDLINMDDAQRTISTIREVSGDLLQKEVKSMNPSLVQ